MSSTDGPRLQPGAALVREKRMRWFGRGVLSILIAVAAALPAVAQSVPPGLGIGIVEVPEDLADDPRARTYIIDSVNPGANFDRRLAVSNGTAEEMTVQLYATAADIEDGWVVAAGRTPNELTEWISVEPPTLTIPPGERREALARFRIPGDASGGERYAAIVAEAPPAAAGGVRLVSRAGVRVYLAVKGEEGESFTSDFVIDTLAPGRTEAGVPIVLVGVTNTGERAVDVSGELRLSEGPGGVSAGPFPVSVARTLGPGDSGTVQVLLDPGIPAGPWLARADLASGLIERSAEATITFPDEPGTTADAVGATPIYRDRGVLLPLALGLLILALLLVFLVWWLKRRKDEDDEVVEADRAAESATAVAE